MTMRNAYPNQNHAGVLVNHSLITCVVCFGWFVSGLIVGCLLARSNIFVASTGASRTLIISAILSQWSIVIVVLAYRRGMRKRRAYITNSEGHKAQGRVNTRS